MTQKRTHKLTQEEIDDIIKLNSYGCSHVSIARKYQLSVAAVRYHCLRRPKHDEDRLLNLVLQYGHTPAVRWNEEALAA